MTGSSSICVVYQRKCLRIRFYKTQYVVEVVFPSYKSYIYLRSAFQLSRISILCEFYMFVRNAFKQYLSTLSSYLDISTGRQVMLYHLSRLSTPIFG